MAELLLRVVDKVSSDPYKDVKLTKRGDVVAVCPDGWGWSSEEQTNPHWRIVKWPALSVSAATVFLSSEIDTEPQLVGENPMLQRRGFSFDLDAAILPAAVKAWLTDDTRAHPSYTVPAGITLQALRKQKVARPDPHVIG